MKPAVLGVSGLALTAEETALFRALPPAGVILFGRNVADPAQLTRLTSDLRAVLPADAVIMVDQEGGRVARLRPPHWAGHPPVGAIAVLAQENLAAAERAAWLQGTAIGAQCRAAGFDMVAAPVLDLRIEGQDAIVGDRSFGSDPAVVARLGLAMARGLQAGGVIPVAKHAPGHGRAQVDSHKSLPRVEAAGPAWSADIAPFRALAGLLPCMMTAHILYEGLDDAEPATQSRIIVQSVIREAIGFRGILFSDDLAMHALSGTPLERAEKALAAGCDIALYCPGDAEGNRAVLTAMPDAPDLAERLHAARPVPAEARLSAWLAERDELLGLAA